MTSQPYSELVAARETASKHVHDAEAALHFALQADVDEWVKAASEKLHSAVLELEAADAALGHHWQHAA